MRDVFKRWRYKRAMFKAIKEAMTDVFPYVNNYGSRSDALRAFKRFEKVNGFKFDPFNKHHVFMIAGCARHENFFRRIPTPHLTPLFKTLRR